MICYYDYISPIGTIRIAGDGDAIIGLWFQNQKYYCAGMPDDACHRPGMDIFIKTAHWLDKYFDGKNPAWPDIPLAPAGTAFQRMVWHELQKIPYGETQTYGQIARNIAARTGRPTSPRAVGGAIGRNPISVIIPCHRVVGCGGEITGYAGGVDKKLKLLTHEQATKLRP